MAKPKYTECDLCVFLLGAGASTSYGFPVMSRFMDQAIIRYFDIRRQGRKGDAFILECYERMLTFRDQCRSTSWRFHRDWDNIEELYTQADLREMLDIPSSGDARALCKAIRWVIWDVYRAEPSTEMWQSIIDTVFKAGMHPVILTTNYDLWCEESIGFHKSWGYYYPSMTIPERSDQVLRSGDNTEEPFPYSQTLIPIIKLHGSANWFEHGNKWSGTTYRILYRSDVAWEDVVNVLGQEIREGAGDFVPAIIPPMLGKGVPSYVVSRQWQCALKALERARQVIVVGYSFPSTDTFMRYNRILWMKMS